MKTFASIVLGLISSLSFAQLPVQSFSETEILKAKGDGAKIIIEKAYSTLFHAQVLPREPLERPERRHRPAGLSP